MGKGHMQILNGNVYAYGELWVHQSKSLDERKASSPLAEGLPAWRMKVKICKAINSPFLWYWSET
jgi:hypothetical protein